MGQQLAAGERRGLQLDLATAILRIEQIEQEIRAGRDPDWLLDRLITRDAPRLRQYLTPEMIDQIAKVQDGAG